MSKLVLISGCSGGGKSTLLEEFQRRGFAVVQEPGRRIVREQQEHGGQDLPWIDLEAFARKSLQVSCDDLTEAISAEANCSDLIFFDRGTIDAAVALEKATGVSAKQTLSELPRYASDVFLTPPWPAIYVTDNERKHCFEEAKDEYLRLRSTLLSLEYEIHIIPKVSVSERADFILRALS